jgi:wobble nucleotide-excising tRNase
MELTEIAAQLKDAPEKIILIYAFNATGKTRLSVAYRDACRNAEGQQTGVYYNAFSEDLFVWDNDIHNGEENIRLTVMPSSLNRFHSSLTEDAVSKKLERYKPNYNFRFTMHEDQEKGIESISFFLPESQDKNIKLSRGEERAFIWCLFLAMFELEGWADLQSGHFFIDDPVSSLDDHNIFVTTTTLYDLIEKHLDKRKILITTHHIGLFSILADWLRKGDKASRYKNRTKLFLLSSKSGELTLEKPESDVFLYHLQLMRVLDKAQRGNELRTYHFALLRQVLENIASFLGTPRFAYTLEQIGVSDKEMVARIVNSLSHQNAYHYQTDVMGQDNETLFKEVFNKIMAKYQFVLHGDNE